MKLVVFLFSFFTMVLFLMQIVLLVNYQSKRKIAKQIFKSITCRCQAINKPTIKDIDGVAWSAIFSLVASSPFQMVSLLVINRQSYRVKRLKMSTLKVVFISHHWQVKNHCLWAKTEDLRNLWALFAFDLCGRFLSWREIVGVCLFLKNFINRLKGKIRCEKG